MTDPLSGIERLQELAEPIAAAWAARARASTTVGRERAVLRTFGVTGLDNEGRPLAWAAVDRWLAGAPSRLGSGIALPFATAMLVYEQSAQETALDVASGAIDLELEGQLLADPERRAAAASEARRLGRIALERMEANRTARGELLGMLGDAHRPWLGVVLTERMAQAAAAEAATFGLGGADMVRVEVPTGRELAVRLLDLGHHGGGADLGDLAGEPGDDDPTTSPVGSQRGLGLLRRMLDQIAAERRAYIRLGTAAPALSAPEQAVVAAFERVDVVEADPFAEIIGSGIDPDRALADHVFAYQLHTRGGAALALGAGPLVVAPDLAHGVPPGPAGLSGRALAMQLLAARIAVAGGLDPAAVVLGAIPDWLLDEPDAASRGLAEVIVRRALHPANPLAFSAPTPRDDTTERRVAATWTHLVAATLPAAVDTAFVVRRTPVESFAGAAADHRATTSVATAVAAGLGAPSLHGSAAQHAEAMIAEARATLEGLRDIGWRAVLGQAIATSQPGRLGADAVAERTEAFDPLD
jgi:hypothetical protein